MVACLLHILLNRNLSVMLRILLSLALNRDFSSKPRLSSDSSSCECTRNNLALSKTTADTKSDYRQRVMLLSMRAENCQAPKKPAKNNLSIKDAEQLSIPSNFYEDVSYRRESPTIVSTILCTWYISFLPDFSR
jgi:hypothetical protein